MDDEEPIINDLSDDVIFELQRRADEHGCTLEEEAYRILKEALDETGNNTERTK